MSIRGYIARFRNYFWSTPVADLPLPIRWWRIAAFYFFNAFEYFGWLRMWWRHVTHKCSHCSEPIGNSRHKYADRYICFSCHDEMLYLSGYREPVSYCCICGGMGGPDGTRCWGCQ